LGDVKNVAHDKNSIKKYAFGLTLLIGGSPCTDLSIAKKDRQGLSGKHSSLFWEYVRILKAVKPRYFLLENVFSMPKEDRQIITEALGVEPIIINAALVSAQNRKRLFWTNIPNVTQPEDRGILLRDILEPKVDDSFIVKPKSNTVRSSGMASGIDDRHNWDTIRIGQIGKGGQGDRIYSPDGKSVNLSANGGGRGAKTGLYAIEQRPRGKNKGGLHTEKSPTLTSNSFEHNNKLLEGSIIRRLTPVECSRLQSLPDDYLDLEGISNTQKYKMLGNGFNCTVIEHILKNIK
jgi:DNA (cytosine-5)-methyltransferase 3A